VQSGGTHGVGSNKVAHGGTPPSRVRMSVATGERTDREGALPTSRFGCAAVHRRALVCSLALFSFYSSLPDLGNNMI
jgi:hypothetical protein